MGSSLELPASLSGTCPGLGTPPIPARPRNSGRYRILPSARLNTSASGRRNDFGADPHGLFPCCGRVEEVRGAVDSPWLSPPFPASCPFRFIVATPSPPPSQTPPYGFPAPASSSGL